MGLWARIPFYPEGHLAGTRRAACFIFYLNFIFYLRPMRNCRSWESMLLEPRSSPTGTAEWRRSGASPRQEGDGPPRLRPRRSHESNRMRRMSFHRNKGRKTALNEARGQSRRQERHEPARNARVGASRSRHALRWRRRRHADSESAETWRLLLPRRDLSCGSR
jgi:hypothetical protein